MALLMSLLSLEMSQNFASGRVRRIFDGVFHADGEPMAVPMTLRMILTSMMTMAGSTSALRILTRTGAF